MQRESEVRASTAQIGLDRLIATLIATCWMMIVVGCGESATSRSTTGTVSEADAKRPAVVTVEQVMAQLDRSSLDTAVVVALDEAAGNLKNTGTPAAWGRLGMLLLAHDLYMPAALCLDEAASRDANDARWPYFSGIALRTIDVDKAQTRLRLAADKYGAEAVAPHLRLVSLLIDQEQYAEATHVLNELRAREPTNAAVRVDLARIAVIENELQVAYDLIQPVVTQGRPNRSSLLLAAEILRRLGNQQAADRCRQLSQQAPAVEWPDPQYAEVLALRTGLLTQLKAADELYMRNQVEASINLLQQICLRYPDSEWARIMLARGYIRIRKLADAKQQLDTALTLNPQSFEAHFRMGVMYQVSQRYDEAIDWFKRTIKFQPSSGVAYRNLGLCQLAKADILSAEASLLAAVQTQPNYFDGHLALIEFYLGQRRFEEATASLAKARLLNAKDPRLDALSQRLGPQQ
ncbi:MAG: tetratricopeptide repeat protein [Planctomycetales bacterium]|nr:tetratricopeptide repeat protein [Planctomycetales bacterium]